MVPRGATVLATSAATSIICIQRASSFGRHSSRPWLRPPCRAGQGTPAAFRKPTARQQGRASCLWGQRPRWWWGPMGPLWLGHSTSAHAPSWTLGCTNGPWWPHKTAWPRPCSFRSPPSGLATASGSHLHWRQHGSEFRGTAAIGSSKSITKASAIPTARKAHQPSV